MALQTRKPASIAQLYTAQAQLLPPNAAPVAGTAAIMTFWESVLGLGISGIKIETMEVDAAAETAVEIGRYTLFADGSTPVDQGKYLVVWKNEEGAWKLHRDIWNSSNPSH